MTVEDILEFARTLTPEERQLLIERLIEIDEEGDAVPAFQASLLELDD